MPSPLIDLKGFSSPSQFSEDPSFPGERQVGFWKSETMPDKNGTAGGKFASSTRSNSKLISAGSPIMTSLHHPEVFMVQQQKVNFTDKAANGALPSLKTTGLDQGLGYNLNAPTTAYFTEGNGINMMGSRYENSLFSSSLSELFSRKMKITSNNGLYGHSIDTVASHYEGEEPLESMDDIEAHMIGNLLPNDDELLSGVTDGLEFSMPSKGADDMEELDLFNSVGGMDLEEDGSSDGHKKFEYLGDGNGSMNSEHPYGEHPSRTLFVRNINSNVEDSELRALFEQYGDIRTLYTACKHRGFVMISYYDIRAARTAMKALQSKPLRRRKLDIHYSIPKDNPTEKDINQGTLVVFNLDSSVSNEELHHIFGAYGEIKEIRETPHRNNHKFIEFYDVRAAEAALHELNRSDIAGKQIKLEPSRPGGVRRFAPNNPLESEQEEFDLFVRQNSPANNSNAGLSGPFPSGSVKPSSTDDGTILGFQSSMRSSFLESAFHPGVSSSVPNSLPSLMRAGSVGSHPGLADSGHSMGHLKFDIRPTQNIHPHSLPDYHDALVNGIHCSSPSTMVSTINSRSMERIDNRQLCRVGSNGRTLELKEVFGSAGKGSCTLPRQYPWGNHSYQPQPSSMMWPNSPSFVNGIHAAHPPSRLPGISGPPSQMLNPVMPMKPHHVGSAPAVNHAMWEPLHSFAGESSESLSFHHPVSLGNMRVPNNSMPSMDFVPHNMFPQLGGNSMDFPVGPKNVGFQAHHQRGMMFPGRGQMVQLPSSFEAPNERMRSRRNEGTSNPVDNKKQYELDIDRIMRGEDNRTTLMIKNIPNKYTSKMLLAAIDERHRGTYDFIYLPIDFKNKCNVGYAFINMTDPSQIIPFYKAFDGKKWEKFNSEKVASLAYARIQGKAALIAHFQNSSLMNEDKRCRPILFNTEGPNAGDQVPFPMGVNVRTRPGKSRTSNPEDNSQGNRSSLLNGEDSSHGHGDTSTSCGKESD
ncbi:protein MEI2-like 4 isoform X2 [Punica granatum]|uniref:Protein MEI2-like 4 isoform X2 n=1 Tax=Punica granatum TaxID=22663 RepID=A0A6P8E1Q3_PUNGR|nr:protein MEI2-like 4 isoform X2 [Punica granatum]